MAASIVCSTRRRTLKVGSLDSVMFSRIASSLPKNLSLPSKQSLVQNLRPPTKPGRHDLPAKIIFIIQLAIYNKYHSFPESLELRDLFFTSRGIYYLKLGIINSLDKLQIKVRESLQQMLEGDNKIYFKGNPYTRQHYIPNSALKNRSKPNYLVQLPSGQDYFGNSRKKQYANMHNLSQIKNTGLFEEEIPTYNHGTYEVSDIEGAVPNSLLSEAVRNRMKGNSRHYNRNGRPAHAYGKDSGFFDSTQVNQYQTPKKLSQNSKPTHNYHFQGRKHVKTEPVDSQTQLYDPIDNIRQQKYNNSPQHNHNYSYIPEFTQTQESRIKQLEQQLFTNQEQRLKEKNKNKQVEGMEDGLTRQRNQSQKRIEIRQEETTKDKSKKSVQDIRSMWHGDNRKIMLFPHEQIRKLNPTYLSSQNYLGLGMGKGEPKQYFPGY